MQIQLPVAMSDHVFHDLVSDFQQKHQRQALLVADENTYPVCGWQVDEKLQEAGIAVAKVILSGQPWVTADENSIIQVLKALNGQERTLIAVGSGTITDIVRFVCFQARLPFISVPTAASVDAYTSYTAAIIIGQVKHSIPAKPASSVFAHLPSLCTAPVRMTASGFGDMVAKYTALADWKLAHLLIDDVYEEVTAQQAEEALKLSMAQADAVRAASPVGITALMESLFTSGFCMVAVKSSRPAAGSEHSLAHFWEIKHRLNYMLESLHGEKTGVATVIASRLYENLRQLSRQEVARRLDHFCLPDSEKEFARIQEAYAGAGSQVITNRYSLLGAMHQRIDQVKDRLVSRWDEVLAIAAMVPPPYEIISLLERAGAPSQPGDIHVSEEEVDLAIQNAMYVRDRFTILELNRMLHLSSF